MTNPASQTPSAGKDLESDLDNLFDGPPLEGPTTDSLDGLDAASPAPAPTSVVPEAELPDASWATTPAVTYKSERDLDRNGTFETTHIELSDGSTAILHDTDDDGLVDLKEVSTHGDGKYDVVERDTDGDGKADRVAIDEDGDGGVDSVAYDHNRDGLSDERDVDADGDGNIDTVLLDTDNDGAYDYKGVDDNGDGLADHTYVDAGQAGDWNEVPNPSDLM